MIKKYVILSLTLFLSVMLSLGIRKELNAAVITNLRLYDSNYISIDDEVIVIQGLVLPEYGSSTSLGDMVDVAITQGNEYYVPLEEDRLYVILNSNNNITHYLGYGFNSLDIGDTGFIYGVGLRNNNPNLDIGFMKPNDFTTTKKLGYIVEGLLYDYVSSEAYNKGLEVGRNEGYIDGLNEILEDYLPGGIEYEAIYNAGVGKGRQEIINEQGGLRMKIIDFLPGVLGSIFLFFLTVSQIGFFGITILDLLGLAFMVGALVFVIRFFFKG